MDEIIDALAHVLENPNAELDEILEFVKGHDFPTGGIIYGKGGLLKPIKRGEGAWKCGPKCMWKRQK